MIKRRMISQKQFLEICLALKDHDLSELENCTQKVLADYIGEHFNKDVGEPTAKRVAAAINHPLRPYAPRAMRTGKDNDLVSGTVFWHSLTNSLEAAGLSNSALSAAKQVAFATVNKDEITLQFFPAIISGLHFDKRLNALQECVCRLMQRRIKLNAMEAQL